MIDDEAEHGRCPVFGWQGWGQPLLADGFVCGRCAWDCEGGVCESGVLDGRAPGDLVADVIWVEVGEEFGEVYWCWGWRGGVAGWNCKASGFGAVGVAGSG